MSRERQWTLDVQCWMLNYCLPTGRERPTSVHFVVWF